MFMKTISLFIVYKNVPKNRKLACFLLFFPHILCTSINLTGVFFVELIQYLTMILHYMTTLTDWFKCRYFLMSSIMGSGMAFPGVKVNSMSVVFFLSRSMMMAPPCCPIPVLARSNTCTLVFCFRPTASASIPSSPTLLWSKVKVISLWFFTKDLPIFVHRVMYRFPANGSNVFFNNTLNICYLQFFQCWIYNCCYLYLLSCLYLLQVQT